MSIIDPLPLLLWCPGCRDRHVDHGEYAVKPHHTHACQSCGMVWRPALGPTRGVQFLPGFKDDEHQPSTSPDPDGRGSFELDHELRVSPRGPGAPEPGPALDETGWEQCVSRGAGGGPDRTEAQARARARMINAGYPPDPAPTVPDAPGLSDAWAGRRTRDDGLRKRVEGVADYIASERGHEFARHDSNQRAAYREGLALAAKWLRAALGDQP